MINDRTDEVREELFQSLLSRYQIGLKTLRKIRKFVFDYVHLLYYKFHKISPKRGGSYMDSPDWIKKATINLINKKDNKCFQDAVIVALSNEKFGGNLERITKINPFIDRYNWEGYPSKHNLNP